MAKIHKLVEYNGCIMKIELVGGHNNSSRLIVTPRLFSVQSNKWDMICAGPDQTGDQSNCGYTNPCKRLTCDVSTPLSSVKLIFAKETTVSHKREVLILLVNTEPVMQWFEGKKQSCYEYHCLLLSQENLETLHSFTLPFKVESECVYCVLDRRSICVGNNRQLFVTNLDEYGAIQSLKCDQIIQIFDVHYNAEEKAYTILAKVDEWGSKKMASYLLTGYGTSSPSLKETDISQLMPDAYHEIITSLHVTYTGNGDVKSEGSEGNRLLICTSYSQAVLFTCGKIIHCTPLDLDDHEAVTEINLFENQEGKEFYVLMTSLQNVIFLEADTLQVVINGAIPKYQAST